MNKNNTISILISSYNHEKYIEECIHSIWEQDYKNIEILVIDDNSQDNTYQKLKELEKNSPVKMKVFRNNENQGISRNLNRLINISTGEIISFMSSDDRYYGRNTFDENLYKLINNEKVQAIYTEGYIWDGKNFFGKAQGNVEVNYINKKKYEDLLNYMLLNVPTLLIQGSFMKKILLYEIKGFEDFIRADDWVLNIKILKYILKNKLEIEYNSKISFLYRQHIDNSIKKRDYLLNLILEVINNYTPVNERDCFKGKIFWGHGLFLLKRGKIKDALKFLYKSQKICPDIKRFMDIYKKLKNLISQ